MAKGHGRKFRRYLKGGVDESLALGTLASKTLISTPMDDAVTERAFLSSLHALWSFSNWTPTTGAGPIMVGVAHSDYTAAEIEAWIEQTTSWEEFDLVGQEIAKRKIKEVGIFNAAALAVGEGVLNEGVMIRTKLKWMLGSGDTLQVWAYNLGLAAVATTDPVIHTQGHANLWPR